MGKERKTSLGLTLSGKKYERKALLQSRAGNKKVVNPVRIAVEGCVSNIA
jgi:hypothetical protein